MLEKYITCVTNIKHRTALTRLRCSDHKLSIEEGRFRNIERTQRLCTKCNMGSIENEYHFVLVCPFYRDITKESLPKYYNTWPTQQKIINLMTSPQTAVLKQLAKYAYLANVKRDII